MRPAKKYLYVVVSFPDTRQEFYENHTRDHNKAYCQKHDFEYLEFNGDDSPFRGHPTWWKFSKVREMINDGTLKEGDTLTHLDADMCIVDDRTPLVSNKSFTYAIDSCNTHCMGLYSLKINEWSVSMLDNLLSEERYEKYKDHKTADPLSQFTEYKDRPHNSFWKDFREQASWYSLAGIQRHSWESFFLLSHYGWHSDCQEDAVYSLKELYEHVEILNSSWNVTHIPEEDSNNWMERNCIGKRFYVNPTHKDQTIVRHWAGKRKWRKEYFER